MTTSQVRRGDIHYANLDPVVGRETGKTRPVLVIQNDIGNIYSPTTIVAVITEYSEKKHPIPSASVSRKEMVSKKIQLLIYPKLEPLTKRG